MIKRLFIFFILTLTSLTGIGKSKLLGIRAGLNWTTIESKVISRHHDIISRKGYSGGLTWEYRFSPEFSLAVDCIYDQRGYALKVPLHDASGNLTGDEFTAEFHHNYLSFPLKVGLRLGKHLSFFNNVALVPSVLFNANMKLPDYDIYDEHFIGARIVDVPVVVTRFDLAGLVEAGIQYTPNNQFWIFAQLSYQKSFTKSDELGYFADCKIIHKGHSVSLGCKYALTREKTTHKNNRKRNRI